MTTLSTTSGVVTSVIVLAPTVALFVPARLTAAQEPEMWLPVTGTWPPLSRTFTP